MNTSVNTELVKNVIDSINQNDSLLVSFNHIILFGSAIKKIQTVNDIDLLLIYSKPFDINILKLIIPTLRELLNLPIDITVLSSEELDETDFLEKIQQYYIIR